VPLNATVATPVLLLTALNVPLWLPLVIVNVFDSPHNALALVGFTDIGHDPLFTVNAYVFVLVIWLPSAVAVTVIVELPAFTGVIVTVPLLIDAVATLGVPLATLNVQPFSELAVKLPVLGYDIDPLVALNVNGHCFFAFVILYVTLFSLYCAVCAKVTVIVVEP
jgi:hypothetical protein